MSTNTTNGLPTILVTGASGFIGRHFLEAARERFRIYALSRSVTERSLIPQHPNIEWIITDIGNSLLLHSAFSGLRLGGGVDYILHLAGFYDFNYDENPEYFRTNIRGTKNILEEARQLNVSRFIFASSLAACDFTKRKIITEETPADATFAYARSKSEGEQLMKQYSQHFPCTTLRFAATFSDWCEYGPLYVFLKTWLSKNWKSHILGGHAKSAITYIHVRSLCNFILRVIDLDPGLPQHDVYIASPEQPVTHRELFNRATRFFFGRKVNPFFMPKSLATIGVYARDLYGKLINRRPFERPWMMQYIDKQLRVDNSYTRKILHWEPTERFLILRRLLFLIERMKSYPYEWERRNSRMLKSIPYKPGFLIYETLDAIRDTVVRRVLSYVMAEENNKSFKNYQRLDETTHRKDIIAVYQFLSAAVRTRDRMSMLEYARYVGYLRYSQGFQFEEVRNALQKIGLVVQEELLKVPILKGMEQLVYDEISMTFQLMIDELEGAYEEASKGIPEHSTSTFP